MPFVLLMNRLRVTKKKALRQTIRYRYDTINTFQLRPVSSADIIKRLIYNKKTKDFIIHACEQSLRFSTVSKWEDLSDKFKMQFSFNVGVMVLGLDVSKEEGYQYLANVCQGESSMNEFHTHVRSLLSNRGIEVSEENIRRPF